MDATVEDALVNWYEVERLARVSAAEARRADVVAIGAIRPKPSPALDGLFRAVEDVLGRLSMVQAPGAQRQSAAVTPLHANMGA